MNPVRSKKPEIPANSLKTNWTSNGMKIALPVAFLFLTTYFLLPTTVSASTIARPMANSGLVGYWSMEEGKGNSRTFDRSGQGNTGTLTNMDPLTDWVNGATSTGQALDFDGSNDYVNVSHNAALDITGNLTLSAWIKKDTNAGADGIIGKGGCYNMICPYSLRSGGTGPIIFAINDGTAGQNDVVTSSVLNLNTWYYVTAVRSGNNVSLYINGQLNAGPTAQSKTPTASGDALSIGVADGGNPTDAPFDGSIDEVRVYDRALTSSEVERLYKLQKPKVTSGVDNTGLVGYWAFEEGVGTRAEDSSFNTNTGTLTNMDNSDWVTGRVGTALDFDGSNDYVAIPNNSSIQTNGVITIAAWIYLTSTTAERIIVKGIEYEFYVSGGLLRLNQDNTVIMQSTAYSYINSWHHVVAVYSDSENYTMLCIDASCITEGSETTSIANTSNNVAIGSEPNGGGNFLNGQIDDVRIYNRALSAAI